MMDRDELAGRCEAATADQQRELLTALFVEFFPEPDTTPVDLGGGLRGMSQQWLVWDQLHDRFDDMLHAGAHLDAALLLLPVGWTAWEIRSRGAMTLYVAELSRQSECEGENFTTGRAVTPALALCAAAIRARTETENLT